MPTPIGSRATPIWSRSSPFVAASVTPGAVAVDEVDRADLGVGRGSRPVDDRPHQLVPGPGRGRQPGDLLEEGQLREAPRRRDRSSVRASPRSWLRGAPGSTRRPQMDQPGIRGRPAYRNGDRAATAAHRPAPVSRRTAARLAPYGERSDPNAPAEDRVRHGRSPGQPLYDPRYEHDACGVGFVADAGGRSRRRVLPLALAGLGSLGHRGAFAADGASSDGAGVLLPLEPGLLPQLAPGRAGRPGVVSLFLPRAAARASRARGMVAAALDQERLPAPTWRTFRPTPRRSAERPGPPARFRAGVRGTAGRPVATPASSSGSSSPGGGWRQPRGPRDRTWPSSPCRRRPVGPSSTRAWWPASGWPTCTPTWPRRRSSATRSSTSAMPRIPVPTGAWPSRSARSPTTVRSTRSGRTARRSPAGRADPAGSPVRPASDWSRPARSCRPTARTRCPSTRRSSSLVSTGWSLQRRSWR